MILIFQTSLTNTYSLLAIRSTSNKMRVFLLVGLFAATLAAPQYGPAPVDHQDQQHQQQQQQQQTQQQQQRAPASTKCRTEYTTVWDTEYTETETEVCNTVYVNSCSTLYKKECYNV